MLTQNRQNYIRESFENAARFEPVARTDMTRFVERIITLAPPSFEGFNAAFFDLRRNIDNYALYKKIERGEAKDRILRNPGLLYEFFGYGFRRDVAARMDIVPDNEDIARCRMPENRIIARAASHHRRLHGKLPDYSSRYEGLPKDSFGWHTIINRLKLRDQTLDNLVREAENRPQTARKGTGQKRKITPDNDTIARAAAAYKKLHGGLPRVSAGTECLPEGSITWSSIINIHLKSQEETLSSLVSSLEGTKISRSGMVMKTMADEEIAIYAGKFYEIEKRLPARKDGREHLPAGGPAWSSILVSLRDRGTTLEQLMKEHAPQIRIKNDDPRFPQNKTIIEAALQHKEKYGILPTQASRSEFLPQGSVGWSNIIKNLPKRRHVSISRLIELARDAQNGAEIRERIKETLPVKPKQFTPADDVIAHAALSARKKLGRMVTQYDGYMELPENSVGWRSIIQKLHNRGLTLSKLMRHELGDAFRRMPGHREIAECAWGVKIKTGQLPNKHSGRLCLPEECPPWYRIIDALRKDRLGLAKLVDMELGDILALEDNPPEPISVREAFSECANYAKTRPQQQVAEVGPMIEPLTEVDKALRAGKVEGIEDIASKPVTGIIDFMLATGLLERRNGEMFAAPLPRIYHLCKTFA